jgi:hypothetical protein
VIATAVGNLIALALTIAFSHRHGMPVDRGLATAAALPVLLLAGPAIACTALLGVLVVALRRGWLLSDFERTEISSLLNRVGGRWHTLREGREGQALG